MVGFCHQNKDDVIENVQTGKLDMYAISKTDFADEVILTMNDNEILQCVEDGVEDKRASNASVPIKYILANAITAKMKTKLSLTNIPTAISDHKVLAKLGYNMVDKSGNIRKSLIEESGLRYLLDKYSEEDWFNSYNNVVQNYIMPKLDLSPSIHIIDSTLFEVNLHNKNYEGSTVGKNKKNKMSRGYKLATIRGLTGDTGIIEEIKFGDYRTHDKKFCNEMIKNSSVLKPGDSLMGDRAFLDKDTVNYLKIYRNVDTYIPLRRDMDAYNMAVSTSKLENKWMKHPNPARKNQRIAFLPNLGEFWKSRKSINANFNACVVWDTNPKRKDEEYFVFITTDLTKTAKQIIQTYELRAEIEEDYRQLKDCWEIETFKSTKIHKIAFHIVCMLFGYLFFQLFKMLPEGEKYQRKSLPSIQKDYEPEYKPVIILYSGTKFGIFTLGEFSRLYASCEKEIRRKLDVVLDSA